MFHLSEIPLPLFYFNLSSKKIPEIKLANISKEKTGNQGFTLFNCNCHDSLGIKLFLVHIFGSHSAAQRRQNSALSGHGNPSFVLIRTDLREQLQTNYRRDAWRGQTQFHLSVLSEQRHESISTGRQVQDSQVIQFTGTLLKEIKWKCQIHSDIGYLHFWECRLHCNSPRLIGFAI